MIDSNTSLLGLIGNPVEHSLSPVMHNQAFAAVGYKGIYLAFKIIDLDSAIKGIKALNFKGISVTIPHKVNVIQYLDEVDDAAANIGDSGQISGSHRCRRRCPGDRIWLGVYRWAGDHC